MNIEQLELYFIIDIFEYNSRKQLIDYLKCHVYNNSNYFDLSCCPDICRCIEADNDFYTLPVKSFFSLIQNNSIIGKHCGMNIRRDNNKYHEIDLWDENFKVIKKIKIVKQNKKEF